ncbi:MAG TPA: EAL domain-containing protein [Vicinamibacteria bacterium]
MAQALLPIPYERGRVVERRVALLATRDSSVRDNGARWLASCGFEVVTAAEAARALELVAQRAPAVVVTDMALRDAEGRALCEAVRVRSAVPVLVLCSGDREARAALQSGADDVARRPYDWHLASTRATRLARAAESLRDLGSARDEVERLRKEADDFRRDSTWLAHFDSLTGLPDAERFEQYLENALASATEHSQVAVAVFDIAHLVVVNSRLGRARANSVLQQVAQRLTSSLRSEELQRACAGPSMSMAGRVGGGLFAAMLTNLPGWAEAKASVRVLLDRLSGRYFAGDEAIMLCTGVGVALAPSDGRSGETLLQKAEMAAAEAAESGGTIRFYGQSSHRVTERSRAIIRLLASALDRGELALHYQPLVEGAEAAVTAAEALLRWESPELGSVPPSEFVPLAEEAGLMMQVGSWVIRTACQQVRAWRDAGLPAPRVAVNVSLCQLVRGDLAQVVKDALEESGIGAELLELELSERGVLRSDPDIIRQLHAIKALGVRLAIDDFGTGNSAIVYLKQFPIDVMKIDQSFVAGVGRSAEDAAITSATIAMARQLGLRVVAEGVEEPHQVEFLRRHGCSEYQGFLFSPPVPASDFAELLRCGLGRTA